MAMPTRLSLAAATLLSCTSCQSARDIDEELTERHPTLTETALVPKPSGAGERFIIRDKSQRIRVDGRVDSDRMEGTFFYYDSRGDKLGVVNHHLDQRHGAAHLYFVNADGPAVGRVRCMGNYSGGSPTGMFVSNWPSGKKKLEREFDQGILQGAKGWREDGQRMTDGEAMKAAIQESRDEDALLTELENFVQLQIRKNQKLSGDVVPDTELEPRPSPLPDLPAPYTGSTAPITEI